LVGRPGEQDEVIHVRPPYPPVHQVAVDAAVR
jgi:hypothetical protein